MLLTAFKCISHKNCDKPILWARLFETHTYYRSKFQIYHVARGNSTVGHLGGRLYGRSDYSLREAVVYKKKT